MSKATKRYLYFGLTFCAVALLFALLYYFDVVKNLTLMLAAVYVCYFVGIALLYNSAYCRKHYHKTSTVLNMVLGIAFVLTAVVLLIIGLTNGQIQF